MPTHNEMTGGKYDPSTGSHLPKRAAKPPKPTPVDDVTLSVAECAKVFQARPSKAQVRHGARNLLIPMSMSRASELSRFRPSCKALADRLYHATSPPGSRLLTEMCRRLLSYYSTLLTMTVCGVQRKGG